MTSINYTRQRSETFLVILSALVVSAVALYVGVAHAKNTHVKVKNCADHKISITVWNRNDNDKIFSSDEGNVSKDDTKKFHCATKKCQLAAGDAKKGVHVGKETVFDRNVRGDVRIEYKDKTYLLKDGHTCDK